MDAAVKNAPPPVSPPAETEFIHKIDYGPPFRLLGREADLCAEEALKHGKMMGFLKKDKISIKKAVHRLDIFQRRVYNVRKYVIVCPGASARAAVRSKNEVK